VAAIEIDVDLCLLEEEREEEGSVRERGDEGERKAEREGR
jgi:hypothetical protein